MEKLRGDNYRWDVNLSSVPMIVNGETAGWAYTVILGLLRQWARA